MKIHQHFTNIMACLAWLLLTNPSHANQGKWFTLSSQQGWESIDLQSFRQSQDTDGTTIYHIDIRMQDKKAKTIANPITGRNLIFSGWRMPLALNCEHGEINITDFIIEDRKFNPIFSATQYPTLAENLAKDNLPIGAFMRPTANSLPAKLLNLCQIADKLANLGTALDTLQVDDNGNILPVSSSTKE